MMQGLLFEFLKSVARFGLAWAAGYLTRGRVIDEGAASRYVEAFSGWLVISAITAAPLVWAYAKARFHDREAKRHDVELNVAIKGPADATVAEVKEIAKAKEGA